LGVSRSVTGVEPRENAETVEPIEEVLGRSSPFSYKKKRVNH
jgi:hypothetical protein